MRIFNVSRSSISLKFLTNFIASASLLFFGLQGIAQNPDWENPAMFDQNKEAPYATLMPFKDENAALTKKRKESVYYKNLNGIWKFNWVGKPIEDFDQLTHKDFRHTNDIIKKDGVFVTTDLKMMGVAGDNSWGAKPYSEYSISPEDYIFTFTIESIF